MSQPVGGDPLAVYKCGQEHELGTTQTNPASGKGGTWTWGPPITSPVLLLLGHMYCLLTKEVSEFTKLSIRWTRDERAMPSLMTRVRKEQGSSCDILPDWESEVEGRGHMCVIYLYTCTACEYGHLLLFLAAKDILQCWPPSWWNVLCGKEPG